MTDHAVELDAPRHRSFRLTRTASTTAVASSVRPAIVLPETKARALLTAAGRDDVSAGGCYSAGPAGVQVWSGPWDGRLGSHGSSTHLGSVDWSYDTPSRHYITIYRVMVTMRGAAAGHTTGELLRQVLNLAGIGIEAEQTDLATPPARDPFRSAQLLARESVGRA